MKKVVNNDEYKEKDEIDAYFSDAKKKSFPIGIIFLLLLLIIIGGCAYYYFVLDSPKNIFLTILNNTLTDIEENNSDYEKVNIDFSLDTNMITNNQEYIEMVDILNEISLSGNIGEDLTSKKIYLQLNTLYEEKDLLGMDIYYEDDILYLQLNNLYSKVIKESLSEEDKTNINETFENYDYNLQKQLTESLSKNIAESLKNANYTKEYVELNNTYVKKITLLIDKKLMEDFYNKLLDDELFMESYSTLEGITESKLSEKINEKIDNLDEKISKISLYLSILKNKFSMLELITEKERITIIKEDNEYNYKYYEYQIIKYQGYVTLEKNNNNNYKVSFSIEDIEEQLNIELNLDLSYEYDKDIKKIDTTNAIDSNSLTESDINEISTNITKNETLNKLIEDIIALEELPIKEELKIATT